MINDFLYAYPLEIIVENEHFNEVLTYIRSLKSDERQFKAFSDSPGATHTSIFIVGTSEQFAHAYFSLGVKMGQKFKDIKISFYSGWAQTNRGA